MIGGMGGKGILFRLDCYKIGQVGNFGKCIIVDFLYKVPHFHHICCKKRFGSANYQSSAKIEGLGDSTMSALIRPLINANFC